VLCGLWLSACAPRGADLDNPAQGGGKADDDFGAPGGLPQLAQSYAIKTDSYLRVRDTSDNTEADLHTYMFMLAVVGQQDSWVVFTSKPCRIRIPKYRGVQPKLADGLLQSMTIGPVNGALTFGDQAMVTSDLFAIQLGIKLADPLNDPVPTDP